ncbi:hypothetical protein HDE69_001393 [Pedobacter cryoconitis]|uniref:Uncharacterized protein n=1 Tax=Pedobacter cryoconitis TaxID=188932 RepID=A0A7W8YRC1_9SPHI|nr:hypothetical protein [Pedobacter cryoconitis]MBB5620344.1 hypothetical protein [Pedobacter cryoconitis]MBB5647154.1 hypothetical protein [Pedobacter cryoconitis]
MEEIQNPPTETQDMIDRKAAWIERMFDRLFTAVQQNPFATMLLLSVAMNFWQYSALNEMNRLRIKDITSLNEKINLAVEKGVQQELPKQLAPYKEKQDSNNKKLDTSLIHLNGTVESVRRYINENMER